MVGGPASVLTPGRAVTLVAVLAAVVAWRAGAGGLPDLGLWPDALIVALVLFPLTFSAIWLLLPLAHARGLLAVAAAFGALAWVCSAADLDSLFNVAKLLAYTLLGFWFMRLFEELWWIALVAFVIPWVDALSVWRGPTKTVVEERPEVFDGVAIAFRLSGEPGSANIGPPDILFFALFLSTAARFGLRVAWTFAGMLGFLAITVIITATKDVGLPALPAVAIGFLLPNVDLIWKRLRGTRPTLTSPSRVEEP